jgi:hypothetical protein
VVNFAIGMTTPPIGYSLFVGASVTRVSLERIALNLWPFFLVHFVVLALVTYVPAATLLLPNMILGRLDPGLVQDDVPTLNQCAHLVELTLTIGLSETSDSCHSKVQSDA